MNHSFASITRRTLVCMGATLTVGAFPTTAAFAQAYPT